MKNGHGNLHPLPGHFFFSFHLFEVWLTTLSGIGNAFFSVKQERCSLADQNLPAPKGCRSLLAIEQISLRDNKTTLCHPIPILSFVSVALHPHHLDACLQHPVNGKRRSIRNVFLGFRTFISWHRTLPRGRQAKYFTS